MKRQLCAAALFALVALPDWASACWVRWGGPVYGRSYAVPVYAPPVYLAPPVYGPPPVYVYPCPPAVHSPAPAVPAAPAAPPRVEEKKPQARTDAAPAAPAAPAEAVRPIANTEPPKPAPVAPAGPKSSDAAPPKPKLDYLPIGAPALPPLAPPKVEPPKPEEKLPPLSLPGAPAVPEPKVPEPKGAEPKGPPDAGAKLPPVLDLPKIGEPKLPPLELPGAPAVPVPAPAPEALPPLSLPPDAPVAPPPVQVEAKASPLAGAARAPRVSVFAATGTPGANGLRKIGFYNHTGRDVQLTVEGRTVTLPAMSYRHAQMPPTFTWRYDDAPAKRETVPADAAGLDVLIRE